MSRITIRHYGSPRAVAGAAVHLQESKITGLLHIRRPRPGWLVYVDGRFVEEFPTRRAALRSLRRPGWRERLLLAIFLWLADRRALGRLASRALRKAAYELSGR